MAHIETGGGGGRKANTELNLIPIIDLMSVLITFLLITAVWTQVSMLQIGTSIYGKKSDETPVVTLQADVVLKINIVDSGYILTVGRDTQTILKEEGKYNNKELTKQLEEVKKRYPEKVDATLSMSDELSYENLIDGMDILLGTGFEQISIATGG